MNLTWIRKVLPYLGIAIGIALIYDGYVFYSRYNEKNQEALRKADADAALAKKTLSMLGNGDLKINSFYASPGAIRKGSSANICYGVMGAKTLKIEPPVADVWPALNHCLQVSPAKDTEYKLIAEDGAGHSATESFVLQVVK